MQSDVSEFLKETKPSLIQILTTQVEAERAREENPGRNVRAFITAAIIIGVIAILFGIGYFFSGYFRKAAVENAAPLIPQPFFSVEKSLTIETAAEIGSIADEIKNKISEAGPNGTITRLVFLKKAGSGELEALGVADFLKSARIDMPLGIASTLVESAMPVYYTGTNGVHLAIVFKTSDPERALDQLLKGEPALETAWSPIFLNEAAHASLASFEDASYRNINYRILKLDAAKDLNIIYSVFLAKHYLIITPSEETLKVVIDRLFNAS